MFTAYVPDRIAEWDLPVSPSVMEMLGSAERSCIDLNHDSPALGSLDALARQLLRAEAVASSRIEGFSMSHRRLAHAQAIPGQNDIADQIVGNIHALERAVEVASGLRTISVDDIRSIHQTLLSDTRDEAIGGLIRDRQNWIGGEGSSPAGADFIPPPPEVVIDLMEDLCAFISRTDIPSTLQAAITHAQFETIHPFLDGNGRVGRALIHVVLRRRGVADPFVPPISLALAAEADWYVKGLTAFRYGDMEDWFEVFGDALVRASDRSREFATAVSALQEEWREKAGRPRRDSAASRLIEILPGTPVIRTIDVARVLGVSGEAARTAVNRLAESGVIQQRTAGRRSRIWESVGLFNLLDSFERELGLTERAPKPTR